MSEPFDLDPDDARVRSLLRRSDGPMTVRPFTPAAARPSAIPVALAGAGLLVVGIVVGTSLAAWRQEIGSPPVATSGLPAPSATHTPAATTTPAPRGSGAPISAGAAPQAGVLFVHGSDDEIYRYDGTTGDLAAAYAKSSFSGETPQGATVLGRHGSAVLLPWNGAEASPAPPLSPPPPLCGNGTVVAIDASGSSCAYQVGEGPLSVRVRGSDTRVEVAPADWGAGMISWDPTGTRLALVRNIPGARFEERAHNAVWVWNSDGQLREMYEATGPEGYVGGVEWSPDGRWIVARELPLISNSVSADGWKLLLIEVDSGRVSDLGTVIGGAWRQWSPRGELAYIRGAGRETWRDKRLVVVSPDGTHREVALPDPSYVQLAPAWSTSGDLAFVIGPSGGDIPPYMDGKGVGDRRGMVLRADGSTRELRCPAGPLEGIRPSADGTSFLLLCRTPGDGDYPLSIWFASGSGDPVPLVHGLGEPNGPRPQGGIAAGGFGYYGLHPHLKTIAAWSLAAN